VFFAVQKDGFKVGKVKLCGKLGGKGIQKRGINFGNSNFKRMQDHGNVKWKKNKKDK